MAPREGSLRPLETAPGDGHLKRPLERASRDGLLRRPLETALSMAIRNDALRRPLERLGRSLRWSLVKSPGQFLWTLHLRVPRRALCKSRFDWRPLDGPLDGHSVVGHSTAAPLRRPLGGPLDGRLDMPLESPRRPGLLQGTLRGGLREALKNASQVNARRPCEWPRKRPCTGLSGGLFKGPSLASDRAEALRVAAKEALQGPVRRAL
ncbi:hypothetical protein M885DRAFT_63640 [Pelagophyceae sp. CCMP2097]|nr:hypothetical protein M885DRAFT_63640 [Pelagophyceae sp. CCMP2097]